MDTAEITQQSNSSDSTDRCSATTTSSRNENAVQALQDCTNAISAGAESEEAIRKAQKNGQMEDTMEKKPSEVTGTHNSSRTRSLKPSINVVHQLFSRSTHGAGRKKTGSVSAPQPVEDSILDRSVSRKFVGS
jgi:hypothetical protein